MRLDFSPNLAKRRDPIQNSVSSTEAGRMPNRAFRDSALSPLSEFTDAQPEFADTRPLPTFLQ